MRDYNNTTKSYINCFKQKVTDVSEHTDLGTTFVKDGSLHGATNEKCYFLVTLRLLWQEWTSGKYCPNLQLSRSDLLFCWLRTFRKMRSRQNWQLFGFPFPLHTPTSVSSSLTDVGTWPWRTLINEAGNKRSTRTALTGRRLDSCHASMLHLSIICKVVVSRGWTGG